MMAVVHNRPVILAGEGHVLEVLFSAGGGAKGADDPCRIVETGLSDQSFDHLIAPEAVRLNDLFSEAGLALRLLRTVVPPLLRGAMWSTSLPSPL